MKNYGASGSKAARLIRGAARRLKIGVLEYEQSGLSGSEYLTLQLPSGRSLKIRFSDHEARPTYARLRGPADYEVGCHQDGDGDAASCIRWLAHLVGLSEAPPPKRRKPSPLDRARLTAQKLGLKGYGIAITRYGAAFVPAQNPWGAFRCDDKDRRRAHPLVDAARVRFYWS